MTLKEKLILEQKELGEKIKRLELFISSEKPADFDAAESPLLDRQLESMRGYHSALGDRIEIR